jgi:MFS family permease
VAAILLPVSVRAAHLESYMVHVYAATFFLNGAAGGGSWMGYTNYVLELAPDEIRPLFLGLASTLCSPVVVMPLIGGLLLSVVSYPALFGIAVACSTVGALYVYRLPLPHQLSEAGEGDSPPAA